MDGSVWFQSALPALLTVIIAIAGVIGTLFNVNRVTKGAIISLIVIAGIATFVQAYTANRDAAFVKGALTTMLASMPETPGFDDAIFDAAFAVAKQNGYYIPSSTKIADNDTVYVLAPQGTTQQVGGMLVIGTLLKGKLYVAYVNGSDLKPLFQDAIFGTDAGDGGKGKQNVQYLQDLGIVCRYVLASALRGRRFKSAVDTSYDPPGLSCTAEDDASSKVALRLGAELIEKYRPMRRGERNAQAYSELQAEVARITAKSP